MTNIFASIFTTGALTAQGFGISIVAALVLGALIALVYSRSSAHSNGFLVTVAMLPAIVAVIIMMVSGSIGASVAVAGAFSLVRFRSAPGTAREICAVFLAMAVGLACGMGHIWIAILFFVIMAVLVIALTLFGFGERSGNQQLKITIPENLDYNDLFDDLFKKYTSSWELVRVRTTNMGTLYELCYDVVLKDEKKTKAFMDEIRCRNGNLNITLGRPVEGATL